MNEKRVWVFYDSLSKTQSNPISTDEAQMAVFKMKQKDWPRFFVWTVGWDNWQPLDAFLKSEQTYFITQFKPTADNIEETIKYDVERNVLEMNTASEEAHKEITNSYSGVVISDKAFPELEGMNDTKTFDGDEMTWSGLNKPAIDFKKLTEKINYGRRAERHEFKIEVLLVSPKGNIFKSTSKNISLTGTLLEDNIPFDFYGITFETIIVNRKAKSGSHTRVYLKAKSVGDGLTQRLTFFEVTDLQKKQLESLLKDYLEQQHKLTKKKSAG